MKSISEILNDRSKYSIDLKDGYELDEFIEFFEAKMRIVKECRLETPMTNTPKKKVNIKGDNSELTRRKYEADC